MKNYFDDNDFFCDVSPRIIPSAIDQSAASPIWNSTGSEKVMVCAGIQNQINVHQAFFQSVKIFAVQNNVVLDAVKEHHLRTE